jgi:hypothetical protein
MGEKLKNMPSPMPHVKSASAMKMRLRFKEDLKWWSRYGGDNVG